MGSGLELSCRIGDVDTFPLFSICNRPSERSLRLTILVFQPLPIGKVGDVLYFISFSFRLFVSSMGQRSDDRGQMTERNVIGY